MQWLALIAADAVAISYTTIAAAISAVTAPFIAAISILWVRVENAAKRCLEEKDAVQKERTAENKEWLARVEALHRDRALQTEKMLDQLAKMAEKSEEAKYATIKAITDFSNSLIRVEKAVAEQGEKTADTLQELVRAIHERRA